jgi:hypothetical protein
LIPSYVSIEEHRNAREKIYFPWIKSKSKCPEGEFHASHESLSTKMEGMREACDGILQRHGRGCGDEITLLKNIVPTFARNMLAHLREKEERYWNSYNRTSPGRRRGMSWDKSPRRGDSH